MLRKGLSIITPVLNGARYIEHNINSILKLNIPFEHIIVDGGSDDGTLDIINRYPHVKLLIQKEQKGMYAAIHEGFVEAQGDFITYINADDRVICDGMETLFSSIRNNCYDLVYSNAYFLFEKTNKLQKKYGCVLGKFLLKNGYMPFIQPSSVYRKERYFDVGGFNYSMFRIMGDRDLFQRIALLNNVTVKYIPVFSSIFLKYGESLGDKNTSRYLEERKNAICSNDGFFLRTVFHLTKVVAAISTEIKFNE